MEYRAYNVRNFKNMPRIDALTPEQIKAIEVVGTVLPFKADNYVVDQLIDWANIPADPIFVLTFPQRDMLDPEHYDRVEKLIDSGASKEDIDKAVADIRLHLNPNPAGQMEYNVPRWCGEPISGFQHKYRETVVFFPGQGQTCHAYCTFCFRWPQFSGMAGLKFASTEAQTLVDYVAAHPDLTDVLFTGGDPLIMKTRILETYIRPLLEAKIPHLRNIRIGSKTLSYWPYRFLTDDDAEDLLNLFSDIKKAGIHLAFMANFNHPAELGTDAVKAAIDKINATGAIIRTQSPILRHINDSPEVWADMWTRQVELGCVPYYMFVPRNTGGQRYFSLSLVKIWEIFQKAYQEVSGICRTVRGPVMSCLPGKVQILGPAEMGGKKLLALTMLQGRNPDWVCRPFFARYDEKAVWFNELRPAPGEPKFFFKDELDEILARYEENEADNLE